MIEDICPCFYYEDNGDRTETCCCGHQRDEHDSFGECEAVYVEA